MCVGEYMTDILEFLPILSCCHAAVFGPHGSIARGLTGELYSVHMPAWLFSNKLKGHGHLPPPPPPPTLSPDHLLL